MKDNLDNWRKQIDDIDEDLITLLAKRVVIIRKIGTFKKKHKISPLDKKRWEDILSLQLKKSEKLGLTQEFVKDVLNLIHKYSLKIQENSNG